MKIRLMLLSPFLLVMIITSLLSISCTSKPTIVGYWQDNQESDQYIEFTSDGIIIVDNSGLVQSGKYEFISENYVKVKDLGFFYSLFDTWKYQISGNSLTLHIGDESKTFKRVR